MTAMVQCQSCGRTYRVRDELVGKALKCQCGEILNAATPSAGVFDEAYGEIPSSSQNPLRPANRRTRQSKPVVSKHRPKSQSGLGSGALIILSAGGLVGGLVVVGVIVWTARPKGNPSPRLEPPPDAAPIVAALPASNSASSAGPAGPSQQRTEPAAPGGAAPSTLSSAPPNAPLPKAPGTLAVYSGAELFAVSANGKKLATYAEGIGGTRAESAVKLWDLDTGDELISFDSLQSPSGLALSADGKLLGAANAESTVVFDATNGTRICEAPGIAHSRIGFSADGDRLIDWSDGDSQVMITTIKLASKQVETRQFGAKSQWASHCAYRPGDGMFAAGMLIHYVVDLKKKKVASTPFVEVGGLDSKDEPRKLKLSQILTSIAFSADGSTLAGSIVGGHIIVWDGKTFEQRADLARPPDDSPKTKFIEYQGIAVSPDGAWAAIRALSQLEVGVGGGLEIWDLARGERKLYVPKDCKHVQFLPNGKLLVSYKGQPLKMFDPATAQPLPLPGS